MRRNRCEDCNNQTRAECTHQQDCYGPPFCEGGWYETDTCLTCESKDGDGVCKRGSMPQCCEKCTVE